METNFQVNKDYMLTFLEALLNTPSPSGYCGRIMDMIGVEAKRFGFQFEITPKGGGIITIPGKEQGPVLGLSAHVDTLGAMVRSITSDGKLKFTAVGGYMMSTIEGEYCQIHTRSGQVIDGTVLSIKPSVHVYKDAYDLKREEANMEIRLDELVRSKEDVEALGIRTGDFISFDARAQIMPSGFVKSRHLDDKASVAILFSILEFCAREQTRPKQTVKIFITNYEEVGHGAAYITDDVVEFIAVDMGAIGDDLSCTEQDVSICAKDSSGPYDYAMTGKLIELAEQKRLSFAVDIYPQYGSDASAALRAGNNIRAALIGPGVHASHGMERTHVNALSNTAALLAAYLFE